MRRFRFWTGSRLQEAYKRAVSTWHVQSALLQLARAHSNTQRALTLAPVFPRRLEQKGEARAEAHPKVLARVARSGKSPDRAYQGNMLCRL